MNLPRNRSDLINLLRRPTTEQYEHIAAMMLELDEREITSLSAERDQLRAELAEFQRIRELLIKSLMRATDYGRERIEEGPLTAAVAHAKSVAECKRDAERWRAHHARKQAVIDAGMARNPMRAVAANMCPHCYAIVGAPHEAWCRSTQINAALAADGEAK